MQEETEESDENPFFWSWRRLKSGGKKENHIRGAKEKSKENT